MDPFQVVTHVPYRWMTARDRPASCRSLHWTVVSATYLDHAATTAVRPEVAAAYAEQLQRVGNPSSVHRAGRDARRVVEEARESIAADLAAHPTEVIFTSGGTEADNLALVGRWYAATTADPVRRGVVISAIEHPAIGDPARWLAGARGADLTEIGVDADGVLDLDALAAHLAGEARSTAVVAVMWANNETGVLQPVTQAAALACEHGVPLHTDAVQAVGHLPVDFEASGASSLALSGHKIGAPIGIGALLARRDLALQPVLHGGGQERGVRSGTLDAPGAHALALAVRLATAERQEEAARLAGLRDRLERGALARVPGVTVRGAGAPRLPGHLLLTVAGADSDALLFGLDSAGVAASSGSACTAGVTQPSHVLIAMGDDERTARSALRLTLGRTSTGPDIDHALDVLPAVVERARAAHRVGAR